MNEPRRDSRLDIYAFFFDIDGTLAPLQATPEAVAIPHTVIEQLQLLMQGAEGALAFVSGRPIAQIDALTHPLSTAVAGIHGADIRTLAGQRKQIDVDAQQLQAIAQRLSRDIQGMQGVQLEKKGIAFALHYRQAPTAKEALYQLAKSIIDDYPDFVVQAGKCVWEIKPRSCDKGEALRYLMKTPPFIGRIPVFIGDDVTDEAGFRFVNLEQGISIKIGAGDSEATYRIANVEQLYQWLDELLITPSRLPIMRSV